MTPTIRRMAAILTSTAAMTMLFGALPLIAQESGKGKSQSSARKAAKRAADPTRRVPNYFAQLGLSEAQRESIYKIQAKHQPRIDALEKQLDDLRAQALKECEGVLTTAQKQMLAERRTKAAETRSKRGGSGSGESAKSKG